jgi:hypothetical protein
MSSRAKQVLAVREDAAPQLEFKGVLQSRRVNSQRRPSKLAGLCKIGKHQQVEDRTDSALSADASLHPDRNLGNPSAIRI